jgi:hypothetical protein
LTCRSVKTLVAIETCDSVTDSGKLERLGSDTSAQNSCQHNETHHTHTPKYVPSPQLLTFLLPNTKIRCPHSKLPLIWPSIDNDIIMDTYYDPHNDVDRDIHNSQSSESSNSSGTSHESREEVFTSKFVDINL